MNANARSGRGETRRIGAHVSTAGGVHKAIDRALNIGANCIQIFAGAPLRWAEANYREEDVARFRGLSQEKDVRPVFIHSSYLLNFASEEQEQREKSVRSLLSGLGWAQKLGAAGVITHLGSSRALDARQAEDLVCETLSTVLQQAPAGVSLLLESCAGQGNTIGRRFEQIAYLLQKLHADPRLQVCLDTAHLFEAGYDISSEAGLESTLQEFDKVVGLNRLSAIHVNDSKTPLGSNVDRHENIGYGLIGEEAFARILRHPSLRSLPFLLEVPGLANEGPDRPNVEKLRSLAGINNA